jgi:hypothetical protein
VKFNGGALDSAGDNVPAGAQALLSGTFLEVSISGVFGGAVVTYSNGSVVTSSNGEQLHALILFKGGQGDKKAVFFSACGPFIAGSMPDSGGGRKRDTDFQMQTISLGAISTANGNAAGDPHLAGPHGIKFDVFGKPAANYSLLVAPAFEVNMQLADRGPEMRFMTAMAVLYKGKSFVIKPWTLKGKRAELIAHFEALGAKVSIDTHKWTITIELCAQHTIVFATHHSDGINYLNFEVSVPGCHDAYGGLLGQTYQCKYAHEKFEWSREREEAFRVATLETASDLYAPLAECAHEDEYRGEAIRGSSFSNSTLSMTTML